MDPLSIAAGSASLAVLCVKVSATLYTWVEDTRQVDSSVTGVCDEILALSRVLDAISKSWKRNPQIASAQIDPDGTLWSSVRGSLDDCRATLEKLGATLEDSYNSAMQSALHMINLCLLLQSNSSQETVLRTLSDLKSQIGRVEGALQSRDNVTALGDEHDESQRISQNFKKLVHAAETFHSSASTIMIEGSRSTVWGGSMLGDPLSQEELSNIENWIPPPGIAEEDEQGEDGLSSTGMSSSAADSSVKREPITGADLANDSDSDSDIEKDLTQKFEELAVVKLEERDYEKAEQFFRKVIDRKGMENQSPENLVAINIKLAYTCCFQGKWEEAENIIVPIATGKQKVDVSVFHGLHTLALLYFERSELDTADKYCKRALVGKKKILGKKHPSYYESINLRARICLAKGYQAESEVQSVLCPA
ncbi:hypothetical protein B0O99DRAFT_518852 [Bisporella sp. PMI_857]|nr:hypothetical protein B0O99DRAFT_518852 [Bisporella sp. PMI_857]